MKTSLVLAALVAFGAQGPALANEKLRRTSSAWAAMR